MGTMQNNQTVGHTNGCCKITFIGKNMTSGKYAFYGITIGLPQEGISYDDENLLGRAVETENIFNCRGNLATKQGGNQTINTKTFDITTNDDFNYVVNNIAPEINRDTFRAILKGTKVKDSVSGEEIVVVGTQGQSWIGGNDFTTLDTFYWLEDDGKLIKPDQLDSDGDPILVGNTLKAPYEKSALIMVEFLYAFNADKKNGDRFAYVMPMGSTFTEGSGQSPNSHSFSMERFSDAKSIKEYYLQGGNMEGTFPTTAVTAQKSLEVKYVSFITPDSGGSTGDFAVVLKNVAQTGTVEIVLGSETTVAGSGTAFQTEFVVGDTIVLNGEARVVSVITSDTDITVTSGFTVVAAGTAIAKATSTIDVFKNTAGAWASIGTDTLFTKGTNIHAQYIAINEDLDDASTVNEYTVSVIKTAGANATAVLYSSELDGTGEFFIRKYDWDYGLTTPVFAAYDGTED